MKSSVSINETQAQYRRSEVLFEQACGVLAGGVSTAFRAAERPVPLFFERASGSRLTDADGRSYLDFVCGFGPVILGHSAERVTAAVARAAGRTQQVGGQHREELALAELVSACVPGIERVRFSSSGSEAVHAAVRLARAATGRELLIKFAGHYHGWFDDIYVGVTSAGPAEPETAGQSASALTNVLVCEWNDVDRLRSLFELHGDRIAAVIMEPLPCNLGLFYPSDGYLESVRELTRAAGTVLIFDEVITGFRIGLGGAQERFGVTPDLTVIAKAMANGFPISGFGGSPDLMELVATNEVLHAGTYNGGGTSVAAALATISALREEVEAYSRMKSLGERLMRGLAARAAKHGLALTVRGPGPVFFSWFADDEVGSFEAHLRADGQLYARFAVALLAEGVRVIPTGRWYLTAAHTADDIDVALEASDRALARLAS